MKSSHLAFNHIWNNFLFLLLFTTLLIRIYSLDSNKLYKGLISNRLPPMISINVFLVQSIVRSPEILYASYLSNAYL